MRIAGEKVHSDRVIEIRYPYTGEVVATVPKATLDDVRRAIHIARQYKPKLTRHERYRILMRAGEIIASRKETMARLITLESGLCIKDTLYEVGRASDVLLFSAQQALVDDGQSFSCDLTHHGKQRRVHTMREPMHGRDLGDHAVQPPAEPGDPQGGAVDRHQQPHGAQAHREDAAGGDRAGRRAVRSRAAAARC